MITIQVAGWLARERQADYMREIERDELGAQARAARARAVPAAERAAAARPPVHRHWRDLLVHLMHQRPRVHGHHT